MWVLLFDVSWRDRGFHKVGKQSRRTPSAYHRSQWSGRACKGDICSQRWNAKSWGGESDTWSVSADECGMTHCIEAHRLYTDRHRQNVQDICVCVVSEHEEGTCWHHTVGLRDARFQASFARQTSRQVSAEWYKIDFLKGDMGEVNPKWKLCLRGPMWVHKRHWQGKASNFANIARGGATENEEWG